jgi:hypothetical protein
MSVASENKRERNIMSERERLDAMSGPMSKIENAKTARVLRDDELDAVSGGVVRLMETDGECWPG